MGRAALEVTGLADFFFYGTLCHPPLLAVVLGRDVAMEPARLAGFSAFRVRGRAFPVLVADGGSAEGVVVRGLGMRISGG